MRYCGACKQVEIESEKLNARDEQRNKIFGRRLPSGHRRYSVRRNPPPPAHDH